MNNRKKACEIEEQAFTDLLEKNDCVDEQTSAMLSQSSSFLRITFRSERKKKAKKAVEDLRVLNMNSVHYNFPQRISKTFALAFHLQSSLW